MKNILIHIILFTYIFSQSSITFHESSSKSSLYKPQGNFNGHLCNNGRILEEIEQYYNTNNNSWENNKKSIYDYTNITKKATSHSRLDEEGYVTEYTSAWQNNGWQPDGKIEYGYDRDGFLIRESNFEYNINGYIQIGFKIFENDTYGNNTYYQEQVLIGGQFMFYKQFHANIGVNIVPFTNEGITETWINGAWQETNRTLWEYENDCLTRETQYWKNGSDWNPSAQTIFEYEYGCISNLFEYCIPQQLHSHNPSKVHWLLYNSNTNEFEEYLLEETISDDFLHIGNLRFYPNRTTSYDANFVPVAQQRMEYGQINQTAKSVLSNDGNDYRLVTWEVLNRIDDEWVDSQRILFSYEGLSLSTSKVKNLYPQKVELRQNFPNPFNPSTTISYDIDKESLVKLTIYDLLGSEVVQLVNQNEQPGTKNITWDGRNQKGEVMNGGVYVYKLEIGNDSETKKMVLLK